MMLADRYRLDMPLGRGGTGEVWMGFDERLNRPVAVKLLTDSAVGDDRSAERFRHEARTAARLNHPRIVSVYDFGVSDGRHFLTMELVNGSSLAHELRRRGPLGPARVATLAAQAAEGLAEAHRQGVVHRDVKPSNLLLDEDGMVKVADFGVARCPGAETTTFATGTGVITGTSLYLAPEAVLGGEAGTAADVYALGCALYELLTGRPPFTGDHPVAVLCQHVEASPVSPCRLCPGLPDTFGDLVLSMLAKSPGERPRAHEVADRFAGTIPARAADPGATVAMPVRAAASPRRRRRQGLVAAGGVTATAALAAAVVVVAAPLVGGAGRPSSSGGTPQPAASGPAAPGAAAPGPGARRHPAERAATVHGRKPGARQPGPADRAAEPTAPVSPPGTTPRRPGAPAGAPAGTPSPTAGPPSASPSAPPSATPSPTPSASDPTPTPGGDAG